MSNKAKSGNMQKLLNPIDNSTFCKMADEIAFCEEIIRVIINDKYFYMKE